MLLARLGAADWQVGLARLIQVLGFTLPALFVAHRIHGRANHKSFLVTVNVVGRAGVLTIPGILLAWGAARPGLALAWFLTAFAIFWLVDGGGAVSWFDIVAKTIPPRVRGRFFGAMQTISGLAAVGAGYIVTLILRPGGPGFPSNFAILASFWCAALVVSTAALFLIREPAGHVDESEEKPPFAAYVRRALPLLRANPRLRRLILTRMLLDGAGMAAPFYVLYAQRELHAPLRMVGVYVLIQSLGRICTGPLWGWLSDRHGPNVGLRSVALAVAFMPFIALATSHGTAWAFPAVFFLLGGVQDALWMVASNSLMGAVRPPERPFAIGVASLFQTPSSLYGLIGGIIAQVTSYGTVFACALVFGVGGLISTLRMTRANGVME